MLKKSLMSITLICCLFLTACGTEQPDKEMQPMARIAEPTDSIPQDTSVSNNADTASFDKAIIQEIIANQEKNTMLSPLSLKFAMNMATLGTNDNSETEKQLLTAFSLADKDDLRKYITNIYDNVHRPLLLTEEEQIATAKILDDEADKLSIRKISANHAYATGGTGTELNNSIWIDTVGNDIKISKTYMTDLADIFRAESFETDLQSAEIIDEVNSWTSNKTHELIPALISEPFDSESEIVLINTLYYKSKWYDPFDKDNTYKQTFNGTVNKSETDFMHMTHHNIGFKETTNYESIKLNYDDNTCMQIYVSKRSNETISDVINKMDDEDIAEMLDTEAYECEYVYIAIPKFETETNTSLKPFLQSIGITKAFSGDAEFSLMLDPSCNHNLSIGDVIQSTKIICDEDGTEAAAATMISMKANGIAMQEEKPIEFIADKPFFYVIKHIDTDEIMFAGVINNFA